MLVQIYFNAPFAAHIALENNTTNNTFGANDLIPGGGREHGHWTGQDSAERGHGGSHHGPGTDSYHINREHSLLICYIII